MKPVVLALFLAFAGVTASAQDPVTTLPEAYQVQLDNDWVKVVRVHYAAGAKLAEHTHPAGTTAYVYLNDSEGVVFRHAGGSNRAVTRPAVQAGGIRLAGGSEEHHTAENPAATPSDFLRIQIKTITGNRNLRQRIPRPTLRPGENSITVDYTSEPLVIQRFVIAAGKSMEVVAATMPSLWIALPSGDTRWISEARNETIVNTGTTPMEFVRVIVRDAK